MKFKRIDSIASRLLATAGLLSLIAPGCCLQRSGNLVGTRPVHMVTMRPCDRCALHSPEPSGQASAESLSSQAPVSQERSGLLIRTRATSHTPATTSIEPPKAPAQKNTDWVKLPVDQDLSSRRVSFSPTAEAEIALEPIATTVETTEATSILTSEPMASEVSTSISEPEKQNQDVPQIAMNPDAHVPTFLPQGSSMMPKPDHRLVEAPPLAQRQHLEPPVERSAEQPAPTGVSDPVPHPLVLQLRDRPWPSASIHEQSQSGHRIHRDGYRDLQPSFRTLDDEPLVPSQFSDRPATQNLPTLTVGHQKKLHETAPLPMNWSQQERSNWQRDEVRQPEYSTITLYATPQTSAVNRAPVVNLAAGGQSPTPSSLRPSPNGWAPPETLPTIMPQQRTVPRPLQNELIPLGNGSDSMDRLTNLPVVNQNGASEKTQH